MYLRFTPPEYHLLVTAWNAHGLSRVGRTTLQRRLAAALIDDDPVLAWRIAMLPEPRLRLLHKHLCDRHAPPAGGPGVLACLLTRQERDVLAEVYATDPLRDQPARARKPMVVEMLWELAPTLARKVERLNRRQFEQLVREVTDGRPYGDDR